MTHDLIWNASGFELLFLASALLGVVFSQRNMREAWHDFRALGGLTNGRRAIAVGAIVIETILLSIHALYIIVAAVVISRPSLGEVEASSLLVQAILVYASWGLTAISYTTRRVRLYLTRYGLQGRDGNGRFTRDA